MPQQGTLTVLEICAGGGGQALGIEQAGFECAAALELDADACDTLQSNRQDWNVVQTDVRGFSARPYVGVDLLAGGVPCPPFSIAGKQLGAEDDRDLFPAALRLVKESRPRAVLIENVRGLAGRRFRSYLGTVLRELSDLGYWADFRVLHACDFGVPQLRPRFVLVALKQRHARRFLWPHGRPAVQTVGSSIADLMAAGGWPGAAAWRVRADGLAPTLVGGSKKHGGADLGPTRAKAQWKRLGVDGLGIADAPPSERFAKHGLPRLTLRMAARLQGFPDAWKFSGKKTSMYRQIGNAFPPPVAKSVARAIRAAILEETSEAVWRRPKASIEQRLFERRRAEFGT